jgi:AraC-like DNA-binding protein
MYKEETGTGLLEYINRLRVERSATLLLSGTPIAQTASRCGFASGATYIRVFKQCKGVTPGKYRELRPRSETEHES